MPKDAPYSDIEIALGGLEGGFMVALNEAVWADVVQGKPEALKAARMVCDKLYLYDHLLSVKPTEVLISISLLIEYGVVSGLHLEAAED